MEEKTLVNNILGDTDERPNIWSKPTGNWARLYLTDFKIHHMVDRNWARNADVHCSGWQISDCSRGYVIKAAIPVWGAQKSFTDGVFQGMTRNTGHRYCKNSPYAGLDLATLGTCGTTNTDVQQDASLNDLKGGALRELFRG